MKKLILTITIIIASLSYCGNYECQPNIPCSANDLKYVEYNPPAQNKVMPSQPVITVLSGDGKFTITWPACSSASSYNFYISTDKINYYGTSSISSPYVITGLTNGVKYYVSASSVNADGEIMSAEHMAIPGVIDNLNGTVTSIVDGLIWSKCNQQDISGNDTYNILTNDCSNGTAGKFILCDTRFGCGSTTLDGTGYSEVWTTCNAKGAGWRVPMPDEVMSLSSYYSATMWPDIINDDYWPGNGWSTPQPYGGYIRMNIINGTYTSANFMDFTPFPGYVICVR